MGRVALIKVGEVEGAHDLWVAIGMRQHKGRRQQIPSIGPFDPRLTTPLEP